MAIQAGLVGLPNVGKSTLFNALTKSSIPAENYPFCTIDPHLAITNVPDKRLGKLAKSFHSAKIIPAAVRFVDIAGLVKGAAEGEGLGNQFLSHILEVDLILHVLRCFEDSSITHVHQVINPLDDFEIICTELMLKDLESLIKREEKVAHLLKVAKTKQASIQQINELTREQAVITQLKKAIEDGNIELVRTLLAHATQESIKTISLLSGKNFLIIANLSEDDFAGNTYQENPHYQALVKKFGENNVIAVSAKIEDELGQLPEEEAVEMMTSLGITERGLDNIIRKSYQALNLITFFTCGPKEARAWSIRKSMTAQEAAGEIHSDLQRGFICAEVYHCDDFFAAKSLQELKAAGKVRTEGKDYIVKDGDVLLIRFNV